MPLTDQEFHDKYKGTYTLGGRPPKESDEDPTWGDYGRLIATGGVQMGSGLGWLFNNFDWGQSLQEKSQKLSGEIMEGLSPQAKKALETEFLERDEGQLWTNNKWSKAKLTAAQSLLGTAAGMGLGAVLTRGLMAAGMARTVTTAAGTTVQVPTKTAGAIGYGLGEAGVAAPSGAAGVEEELKAMSHDDLYANAIDYRAVYDSLEGTPEDRERRAKEYLAKAAAGDAFAMNLVSTFLLSAPLGAVVGGYTGKLPLASTRPRSIATGAAGEAGQEFLQSGAEAIGSNIAMQQADPSRSPFEGALEEAVGGFAAGGLMGGGFGMFTPLEMPETAPPSPDDSPLAAFNEATAEPIEDTLSRLGEALSADLNEPTLDQLQADMEPMDALDWQLQILGETLERDLAGQQAKFEDTERLERKARFGKLSEVETQVNERTKAETELERQRAEQKKKEEDEAFRQRELLIAQEGMNRETATQETELEMPTPTRAPAVNPEEQLEIERGIGGGGDVAGRPIETAPREVEVIKGAPGAPERSPRTPPPPSGTMAAKEEADRRLAERQIAPKTATFKDAFEQSQKAAEQREQQKQEQQQARKRAAKARERAARERAAQEEERLINDEARLESEARMIENAPVTVREPQIRKDGTVVESFAVAESDGEMKTVKFRHKKQGSDLSSPSTSTPMTPAELRPYIREEDLDAFDDIYEDGDELSVTEVRIADAGNVQFEEGYTTADFRVQTADGGVLTNSWVLKPEFGKAVSELADTGNQEADIDIPFAEDEFPPKPELEWADERLADRDYHRSLDRLVSETSAGGGVALVPDPNYQGGESDKRNDDGSYEAPTIRTSSTNPPWMQSIVAEERVGRDYIIGTVEKAKAGKRLGAKQKRIIQAMLDEVDQPSEYAGQIAEAEAAEQEGLEGEYEPAQQYPIVQIMEDEEGVTVSFGGYEQTYTGYTRQDAEARFREQYADVLGSPEGRAAAGGVAAQDLDTGGETVEGTAIQMPEGATMLPTEQVTNLKRETTNQELEETADLYLDDLEQDIRENGWKDPIEVGLDERGNPDRVIQGNHRLAIAARLGLPEVPVIYISDDIKNQAVTQAQRINAQLLLDPASESKEEFKTETQAVEFGKALTSLERNAWTHVEDALGDYYERDGHIITIVNPQRGKPYMQLRGREAEVAGRTPPRADLNRPGDIFTDMNPQDREQRQAQIDVEEQTQGITTTDEAIAYAKQQKFDDESINMFDSVEEMDDPSPEARKLIDELMTFDPTTPAEQRNAFLDKAFDLESLYDKDLVQIVADLRYGAYLDIEEVDISEKTTRKTGPHFTGKILLAKRPGGKYQAGIERLWNTGDYGGMFSGPSFWGDHFDSREEALLAYLKPLQASMENFDRRNNSATTTTQENTAKRLAKQFQEQIDALNQPELVSYEEAPTEGPFKLNEARFNEEGPDTLEQVFSAIPPIDTQNRVAIDTRLRREGNKFITSEEAADKQAGWEKNAIEQGRTSRQARGHKDNFNRVIISLFDTTGKWANPYALAGYDVRTMDIKDGIDVTDFSVQYLEDMFGSFEGKEIYGVLAACPCTTFANSSTKWRRSDLPPNHPQNRHENADPEYSRKWIEEMWGKKAAEAVDENGDPLYATPHDYAIALVNKTIQTLEYLRPKFWAVENPEGRIEEAAGLPNPWRTGFQPHNFGDPYTKRTLLWGNFNDNLPTANVDPVEGSKMHTLSPSEDRAAQRSETPDGFALAFFQANNFLDTDPRERTMKDYWYVEGAIDEAFRAGVTEEQIRERVYLDVAFEPDTDTVENTLAEIRALIDEVQGGGPTTPPTPPSTPTPTPPTTPEVEAESETQTDVVRVGIGGAGSGLTNITIRQINDLTVQELAKKNDQVDLQFYALRLGLDDTGNKIALAKRIKNHLNASATETPATTVKPFIISPVIGKAGEIQGISQLRLKRIANNFAEVGDKVMQNVVTSDDKKIRVVGTKAVYTINVSNRQDGLYVDSVDVEHFGTPNTSGLPTDYKSKKVTHIKDALIALDRALQDKGGSDTQGRARYAVVKDLLNAPDEDFVKAVLGGDERKMGDVPDTAPLNIAVSELLAIEEQQRKDEELAATKAEAVTPEQMWPPGRVEKDIGKINQEFPGANIEVVSRSNIQDRLKAGLLPTLETFEEKIEDLTVPAMYDPDSKTIYIFKDRIMPGTNLRKLALHEMVHKGLDNMFDMHRDPKGRVEYNALMDDIYNRVPDKHKPLLKRIENDYKLDNTNLEDRRIAAEELVANLAERNVKDGIVARAIRFIRNFLERVGMITKEDAWTNEDIRKLIAEAHGAITAKDRTGRVTLTEEVVLGETGEVYEVEMPAAELLNEIEQRKAICKKIQACL